MIKAKVGDKVMIECRSGLGSGGPSKVTKVTKETMAVEKNGDMVTKTKEIRAIWCDKRAFDAKSGIALNPPWMYYIRDL